MASQKQSAPPQPSSQPQQSGFRPVGGLVYGAIACAIAFVLTVVYFFYRVNEITEGNLDRILPDEPAALGWPFYNAHRVDISVSPGDQSVNYLELIDPLNPLVFSAIPAVVLVLAGYVVASRVRGPLTEQGSATAGASVAVGYVPLLVAGTFVFEAKNAGTSIGPEIGGSLLLFGTLFAVLFGAVGGVLGG